MPLTILLPSGRKAWELPGHNDDLSHLYSESKLRTVLWMASHKAKTREGRKALKDVLGNLFPVQADKESLALRTCPTELLQVDGGHLWLTLVGKRTTSPKEEFPSLMTVFQTPPLWFLVQHFFFSPWENMTKFITPNTALIMSPTVERLPIILMSPPIEGPPVFLMSPISCLQTYLSTEPCWFKRFIICVPKQIYSMLYACVSNHANILCTL